MPLYEYYCPVCAKPFELLRPMSQAATTVSCPEGHPGANRLISLFTTISKDGGALPLGSEQTGASRGSGCACGTGGCGCAVH